MKDIVIENLSKSFGEKKVFGPLSFKVGAGGIYRISAPSGAGKTTLLRILAGLEKADSGKISGLPEKIGLVFQEDRLVENISLEENISLVLPGRGPGKTGNPYISDALGEIGLEGCAAKYPRELSGGMKRRAAIVRAVLFPCSLLLLDEPFTGLDKSSRALAVNYLLKYLKGRSCIIAGHISDDILDSCSELIDF